MYQPVQSGLQPLGVRNPFSIQRTKVLPFRSLVLGTGTSDLGVTGALYPSLSSVGISVDPDASSEVCSNVAPKS